MGRRLTAANSATQLTVTRDLDGLVLTRAQTVPNVTVTLQRNDPRGYVTAHQAEHFWEFTRDALGRRQTWSLTPSGLLGWNGIDPAGQPALTWNPPTQAELDTLLAGPPPQSIDDLPPSGRAHEQTWALGLLAGTELRHDGQVVHTRSHTHTPDGRIATLDDNLLGVQAYAYDDVGRLAAADYTLPDLSTMSWTWTYDTAGNRLSETSDAGTATYAYTSGDRLASVTDPAGTTTWTYDSMGRPTAKTEPGPQTTTYTYDAFGRLETVTFPDTTLVGYEYDPWGDRIAKHVTAPQAATTSTWYYRDARLFYEYDDQQNLIAATGFAEDGHTPIWRSTPTGDYLYTTDHLGTPILLTDLQGTIVWHARYAPFGQANELVATVEQPWRFPGQYHDPETGLHYNRQRFYDPKTGRYLTPDPIGQTGGLNIYGYASNDPVGGQDFLGLSDFKQWMKFSTCEAAFADCIFECHRSKNLDKQLFSAGFKSLAIVLHRARWQCGTGCRNAHDVCIENAEEAAVGCGDAL